MSTSFTTHTTQTFQNVMEEIVTNLVDQKLQRLDRNLSTYINRVQVITYALNRLPPLYASSEEGVKKQKKYAQLHLKDEIFTAIQQAFAAVQRDPLRSSTPLVATPERQLQEALEALDDIREAFAHNHLSWQDVAQWIRRAVHRRKDQGRTHLQVIHQEETTKIQVTTPPKTFSTASVATLQTHAAHNVSNWRQYRLP